METWEALPQRKRKNRKENQNKVDEIDKIIELRSEKKILKATLGGKDGCASDNYECEEF